jgi:NTP pyrophosphatase (non-canonical NTP hydrolase)
MAGMTVCTTKTAMDWIAARSAATKEPMFQEAYEKLASALNGRGEEIHDRNELIELVQVIADLDKRASIDHLYDKRLPDPLQTVFNSDKLAEEMVDVAGRSISLAKLAQMPATFWGDIVGDDMVREFSDKTGAVDSNRLRDVLQTLPLDLKIVLRHQVP